MKEKSGFIDWLDAFRKLAISSALVVPIGIVAGTASAGFLWALDWTTRTRWENGWLIFLLPIAGVFIVWLYQQFGGRSERGSNLLIEEIHEPGVGVPVRMAPLILVTTLITHLFGGSAGREGTAVQMGGSLASGYARWLRIPREQIRTLLMAGVAAGFGSVFGTPVAGAVFAMEVLVIGRINHAAAVPVLIASVVGDYVCTAWGIDHGTYRIGFGDASAAQVVTLPLLGKVLVAALAFGLVARLFAELTRSFKGTLAHFVSSPYLRPVIGGLLVVALVYLVGTQDYLGIGTTSPDPDATTISSAFHAGGASTWAWGWKLLFTVITVGSGFKGGEVTPLFFIGATLGNTLALLLGAPVDLFAAIGLIAVFAGATNTPFACTIIGIELFGAQHVVYFAVTCFVAYLFSGARGIYTAQRPNFPTSPAGADDEPKL